MKDQYLGDVNDYRKYGLLRALQSSGEGSLLLAWMLTPDDGGRDGERRSYLQDPTAWSKYDPGLFEALSALLPPERQQRAVSLIEESDLLPRASYYSAMVPDGRRDRHEWSNDLLRAASGLDLAFVDPDNGIEVPSKPVGRKGSSKYVTWLEIEGLWRQAGCSILIYQHFRRRPREAFAKQMVSELRDHTGALYVEALRTPHVLFLLAAQDRHVMRFRDVVSLINHRWSGQVESMELDNIGRR